MDMDSSLSLLWLLILAYWSIVYTINTYSKDTKANEVKTTKISLKKEDYTEKTLNPKKTKQKTQKPQKTIYLHVSESNKETKDKEIKLYDVIIKSQREEIARLKAELQTTNKETKDKETKDKETKDKEIIKLADVIIKLQREEIARLKAELQTTRQSYEAIIERLRGEAPEPTKHVEETPPKAPEPPKHVEETPTKPLDPHKPSKKASVGRPKKVAEEDISKIKEMYAKGATQGEISKIFKISPRTVRRILNNK